MEMIAAVRAVKMKQKSYATAGKVEKKTSVAKKHTKAAGILKKPSGVTSSKPMSVHVEASVSHVLARTGKETFPRSKSFPYKQSKEIPKAKAAAWEWLKSMAL